MTFGFPGAFYFLLAAVPITALFFLRHRYRRETVPYLYFWRQVFAKKRTFSLFQRLRDLWALLLALAALALLVFALSDPAFRLPQSVKNVVILIDNTASMNADDIDPSRLAWAKRQAREAVRALSGGHRVLVAEVSDAVYLRTAFGRESHSLLRAVDRVKPTVRRLGRDRLTDYLAGLDAKRTSVYFFTDKERELPAMVTAVYPPGRGDTARSDNIGILHAGLRRSLSSLDTFELFLRVRNYSARSRETTLEITKGGFLWKLHPLTLNPLEDAVRRFPPLSAEEGDRFEVHITDGGCLKSDDHAYFALPPSAPIPVDLSRGDNYYLRKVLAAIGNIDYTPAGKAVSFILDRPVSELSEGRYIIFRPKGRAFRVGRAFRAAGVLTPSSTSSPVTRYVEREEVEISAAYPFTPAAGGFTRKDLMTVNGRPVLTLLERRGVTALVFAFDPRGSDFVLKAAFPILMANALRYLTDQSDESRQYRTGDALRFDRRERAVTAVTAPDGTRREAGDGALRRIRFERPGFYRVEYDDGGRELYACNLVSAEESDTRLPEGEPPIIAGARLASIPLRRIILIVLLVLLAAEWWLYQQRVV